MMIYNTKEQLKLDLTRKPIFLIVSKIGELLKTIDKAYFI